MDRARIRFAALGLIGVSVVLLIISFATANHGQTVFGPPLGADFAGLYCAGSILNEWGPARDRLYDSAYQDARYHELLPNVREEEKLPFVYPPFVAAAFRLLARLPYERAFAVWLLVSAGLYVGSLALTWHALRPTELDRTTVFLLALSFEPFLMETWLGGQLSAVGVFCFALSFCLERHDRNFAAGAALGLCLYKPTLLVLFVPLLVVARRVKMLAGFVVAALALAALSLWAAGTHNCQDFIRVLWDFAQNTTGAGTLILRLWKYVDLNSFFRMLLGGSSAANGILLLLAAVAPLSWLMALWWRYARLSAGQRDLVWAATLTWTLLINIYVCIYDASVMAISMTLTAAALRQGQEPSAGPFPRAFQWLCLLVYLVPWLTQPLARWTGFQALTPVLAAMGSYQLHVAGKKG